MAETSRTSSSPATSDGPETRRITARHEVVERNNLLSRVIVTKEGIAVSENPVSGVVLRLAAVRIADGSGAAQIPFELSDQGDLVLPASKRSRVGLFLGHTGLRDINAVVRTDEYPGEPLLTRADERPGVDPDREVLLRLGGIQAEETRERVWAAQVKLYERLDFDPAHTRGVFWRMHQPRRSTTWDTQPLLAISPDASGDIVGGVAVGAFQVMGYETALAPPLVSVTSSNPDTGGDISSIPGVSDGLYADFRERRESEMPSGLIRVIGLQGAFQVNVEAKS